MISMERRMGERRRNIPPWTSFMILVAHLERNALSKGKAPAVMTDSLLAWNDGVAVR